MSSSIKILPPELANKIAAGEVVGRPASVVKELIENSIDAHATAITVIVKEGGSALIQMIDNGIGMSKEDAGLAFLRHATSKISSYEDIENISTLGFRGEALASIAAVAQVELVTRQSSSDVGTKIRFTTNGQPEISQAASAPGTSVTVKNLFYNTPGRRNFLKSINTEFKHIYDVVQRVAISHPEIAIKFISGEETILNVNVSSLDERIKDIFGEKLFQTLFYFEHGNELVKVHGYLGKPDFARKSRVEQYLFLNNRSIVNRNINHAVFQAYEHLLEKGSFPFFILFLTIDPRKVDVNVHPSKMEVKFEDEGAMYRVIVSSVRRSLSEHDLIPMVGMRGEQFPDANVDLQFRQQTSASRIANWTDLLKLPAADAKQFSPDGPSFPETLFQSTLTMPGNIDPEQLQAIEPEATFGRAPDQYIPQPATGEKKEQMNIGSFLWQIHNKYIMMPIEGGLMMIDQHAAHERVIYERTIARFNETHTQSQQLLFPHTIEMTPGDAALVQQLQPLLEQIGFSIKLFGKNTVILDGVPVDVKPGEEGTILQRLLDLYKEDEQQVKLEPRERLAKSFSCRAAIKKGDPLNQVEIQSLLDQLFKTEIPYVCPHGRPVIVKLSLAELDRRFGRTS
jgi:DNA mismatch repair protein MutL